MTVDQDTFQESQNTVYVLKRNPDVPTPDEDELQPMVKLINGKEQAAYAATRLVMFQRFWSSKKRMIQEIMTEKNDQLFREISQYLMEQAQDDDLLKSAILMMGSNISNHPFLLANLTEYIRTRSALKVVSLVSKDCHNLRSTLISLIRQVVEGEDVDSDLDRDEDVDTDEKMVAEMAGKFLPYDFDCIVDWFENSNDAQQVVVIIEDSELFDPKVLDQLIELVRHSRASNNIKFAFGLSSSVMHFEDNLRTTSIDAIEGRTFNMVNSRDLFRDITDKILFDLEIENNEDFLLLLGPNLLNQLAKCENDEHSFFDVLKYAYSIYFFNNPLSLLNLVTIDEDSQFDIDPALVDLLRRTPSFYKNIEALRSKGERDSILALFENDEALAEEFKYNYRAFYRYGVRFYKLLDLFVFVQANFNEGAITKTKYQLYSSIIRENDEFCQSQSYQELLALIVQNSKVSNLDSFLSDISDDTFITHDQINAELGEALLDVTDSRQLKMVCKKLARVLDALIKEFLEGFGSIAYKEVFTVEVQADETESIISASFNPFIRSRIETALISPNSYLMGAADSANDKISRLIEPIVCELFALYREATIFVNIHDFFVAFKESLQREKLVVELLQLFSPGHDPELQSLQADLKQIAAAELTPAQEKIWEKLTLSWFYQAMSDLELIGLIKEAKKKTDSVEKLLWKGI